MKRSSGSQLPALLVSSRLVWSGFWVSAPSSAGSLSPGVIWLLGLSSQLYWFPFAWCNLAAGSLFISCFWLHFWTLSVSMLLYDGGCFWFHFWTSELCQCRFYFTTEVASGFTSELLNFASVNVTLRRRFTANQFVLASRYWTEDSAMNQKIIYLSGYYEEVCLSSQLCCFPLAWCNLASGSQLPALLVSSRLVWSGFWVWAPSSAGFLSPGVIWLLGLSSLLCWFPVAWCDLAYESQLPALLVSSRLAWSGFWVSDPCSTGFL
jgi:hypothetical protein